MNIFLHINYYHHYHTFCTNINITTITTIIIIIITIVTIKPRFSVKILKAKTEHLVWFNILLPYKSYASVK